ncbi:PREDICTED: uncharacterized protein LOC109351809 [Lupinus angustifolius]|uniref:uncharacterized protein LOC109351809 n=1 Tax=Lupinus angustifolius TaxID=3871 RepID=UPI00092E727B|nr:PREDICTED: uncharacterized protein LOC109351809 [Lupinus angustifolius]
MKKCSFGQSSIEYLGHIISEEGVAADTSKIEAVKTVINLSILRNYGKLAKPLTDLLMKDSFIWTKDTTTDFEGLTAALMEISMLVVPNFNKQFVTEIDASSMGLGDVLMQEGIPLAFWSRGL